MRHLSDALDQVRRSEYKRVNDKDRKFIKGQRFMLLFHKANLDLEGRRSLRTLLKANKRLKSFEKFAAMIERHWDGIVSYCHPDHKVPLGFMEGLNNKIRVIQRRAYGIKDQEYLMLSGI